MEKNIQKSTVSDFETIFLKKSGNIGICHCYSVILKLYFQKCPTTVFKVFVNNYYIDSKITTYIVFCHPPLLTVLAILKTAMAGYYAYTIVCYMGQ